VAWIAVELDGTLLESFAPEQSQPTDGAVEAMWTLADEGHRLTVYTSRFSPMPESSKQRLKEEIEGELQAYGFPPMEVWTGTTRPSADVFLGHNHVTYDQEWGLALAQLQTMLEERGLLPGPQPGMEDDMSPPEEGEEVPPE
jgi:hypothetical protein